MKKSNFRWVIIFLLFTLNVISYVDRSAIAYAVPDIMQSVGLNAGQMGLTLGAFGIGYLIATFFGGIAVDKFGARHIILIFALIWAVSVGLTGLINGFILALVARGGLGIGEGPTFPAVARSVSQWLPLSARAKAFSNSLVGVPLSLAIGAPITTVLITVAGWRWMFFILALLVIAWWPFFYFFFHNKPNQSRFVNQAELEYIENKSESKKPIQSFWRALITNKTLLSNNWGFFVFGYSLFFFMTWLPTYLEKQYHMDLSQVGLFAFLPWALAAVFLWIGGYLSDFIYQKTRSLRFSRSYIIMAGQLFTLIFLIPIVVSNHMLISLVCISLAMAFNLSNNTVFYSVNLDVAKERAGSALGVMNSGFAIAGFISPAITGYIVEISHSFTPAFILMIALTVSSIIAVFFFHRPDHHSRKDLQSFPSTLFTEHHKDEGKQS